MGTTKMNNLVIALVKLSCISKSTYKVEFFSDRNIFTGKENAFFFPNLD